MPGSSSLSRLLLALTAILASSAAFAAPVSPATNATGTAAILHPLELIKKEDLDFGYVAPATGAGTVVVDPVANTTTATGGVVLLGGAPHAALFTGAAKSNAVVIIRIPKQPITLTRVGGTESMIVSKFTLEGLDKRAVAAMAAFDFRVGATLNVGANQADGLYVGTFEVSVQYP